MASLADWIDKRTKLTSESGEYRGNAYEIRDTGTKLIVTCNELGLRRTLRSKTIDEDAHMEAKRVMDGGK